MCELQHLICVWTIFNKLQVLIIWKSIHSVFDVHFTESQFVWMQDCNSFSGLLEQNAVGFNEYIFIHIYCLLFIIIFFALVCFYIYITQPILSISWTVSIVCVVCLPPNYCALYFFFFVDCIFFFFTWLKSKLSVFMSVCFVPLSAVSLQNKSPWD